MLTRDPATYRRNRMPDTPVARSMVKYAYNKALKTGVDPRRHLVAVDVGCSPKFATSAINSMPCMTATRASQRGHWCSVVGRPILAQELWQFQGVGLEDAEVIMSKVAEAQKELARKTCSAQQICNMLGNSRSLNVVEQLLCEALPDVGLATKPLDH